METIVQLQNVNMTIQQKPVLEHINFTIRRGEQWGILGLNGSGKTTLLNILAAYNFPSEGTVEVLGERFGETYMPTLRQKIGFVSNSLERFSDYYKHQSIEQVIMSGKYASFGIYEEVSEEDERRASELLEQFELSDYEGKPFELLSEGEKRRVLIARALMNEPAVLILDEPCSGLDILAREQFLRSLHHVVDRGCHIIYVTHHTEELVPAITNVLLLKEGRIVKQGEKEQVLTDELLTEVFNVPVSVRWERQRPYVTVDES